MINISKWIAVIAVLALITIFCASVFVAFGTFGILATIALILLVIFTPRKESGKEKLKIQLYQDNLLVRSYIIHDSLSKWQDILEASESLSDED